MENISSSPDQPEWHPKPVELGPQRPRLDHDGTTPIERLEAGRPQLEQLLTSMAPDIRAGRWDAILGDDVSGRIPTLILRSVIARVYAEEGIKQAPSTYFVAMGKEFSKYPRDEEDHQRELDVKQYLDSGKWPQRVLFVTDNIAGGGSIQTVLETLDDLGIPCDVASVQEPVAVVEQVSGHVPYSEEDARTLVDRFAAEGRIHDEEERAKYLQTWTSGSDHGARDPQAKYYGVENPISGYDSQPFHLARGNLAIGRSATGVEKYGGPVSEGRQQHEIRALHGGRLADEEGRAFRDGIAINPDAAELRKAAIKMADELYKTIFATRT